MDLITIRAQQRKTQWDIHKLTGIHQSKISLIERGYIRPTEEEKQIIAKSLSLDVNDIDWTNGE